MLQKEPTPLKAPNEGSSFRVLQAAIDLFAEKGYASTSVREIVALAGVTKPVLYYYFENKEGLLRAILDRAAAWQEALVSQVLGASGTAEQKLDELFTLIYRGIMEEKNLFKFIHNLVFGPPQGTPPYDLNRFHRIMKQAIETIYRDGLAGNEMRRANPEEVAYLIMGLADFCFHLDCVNPHSLDPGRFRRLLCLAFDGLGRRK